MEKLIFDSGTSNNNNKKITFCKKKIKSKIMKFFNLKKQHNKSKLWASK